MTPEEHQKTREIVNRELERVKATMPPSLWKFLGPMGCLPLPPPMQFKDMRGMSPLLEDYGGEATKSGSCWLESKTDPRWNFYGQAITILFSSGQPQELTDEVERKTALLGPPPDDLEWGAQKY